MEALKEGAGYVDPARSFQLILNDRAPGMTGPGIPAGGECHLLVWALAEELEDIEQALRNSGTPFQKLGVGEVRRRKPNILSSILGRLRLRSK
jgi:hypothetical protein